MDSVKIKNILINFIVPIICLIATVILCAVFLVPAIKNVPVLKTEEKSKTQLGNTLKDKQGKLNRLVDFKTVLEENSALVDRVMPADGNVPGLLDEVNTIADESGLDVVRLNYSLGGGETSVEGEAVPTTYSSVLVSLGADGSYQQMIAFMKGIENAARIVQVTNFRFSINGESGDAPYSFTFILSAPYLSVQSTAVTDEPLTLDISDPDFVNFINKIKVLRYYEKSAGDTTTVNATEAKITAEPGTPESTSTPGGN